MTARAETIKGVGSLLSFANTQDILVNGCFKNTTK